MCRYVFYRCVSGAWEIAVGSLWNVSVCFYRCVSVAWVVASWVGGCKENLDDIRAKPFQAIHKHILTRKPHTCLLEIQDVPQSRNGSMGSMICSPLFSLSFSGLRWSSLGLSGPLWASLGLSLPLWPSLANLPSNRHTPISRGLGRSMSVAGGMYRYVFYRCVSVAWEIAVGSLWNVSVCVLSVCVGCLGDCCR